MLLLLLYGGVLANWFWYLSICHVCVHFVACGCGGECHLRGGFYDVWCSFQKNLLDAFVSEAALALDQFSYVVMCSRERGQMN